MKMVVDDDDFVFVKCEVVATDTGDVAFMGGISHSGKSSHIVDAVERDPEREGMIVLDASLAQFYKEGYGAQCFQTDLQWQTRARSNDERLHTVTPSPMATSALTV